LQQIRNQGIIESLPSQLKEVCIRYLSVFEEGELDVVQDEWIVKRRNCAATLNNRGSKPQKSTYRNVSAFFILVF
jgi:hypothetical protein